MSGSALSISSILQTNSSKASRLSSSIPKSLALRIISSLVKSTSIMLSSPKCRQDYNRGSI